VKTWTMLSTFLRFFDMTLQKNVKNVFPNYGCSVMTASQMQYGVRLLIRKSLCRHISVKNDQIMTKVNTVNQVMTLTKKDLTKIQNSIDSRQRADAVGIAIIVFCRRLGL